MALDLLEGWLPSMQSDPVGVALRLGVGWALCSARTFGVATFLPLLGKHTFGLLVRNALVLIFSFPRFWSWLGAEEGQWAWQNGSGPIQSLGAVPLFFGLLQEILLGGLIGFSATIPFWAIDLGCFLIDTLRGSSMSVALNPTLGSQSSGFGLFFSQLLAVLFLSSGGLESLLVTLYDSYQSFPLMGGIAQSLPAWLSFAQTEWTLMLQLGLSFSLPALVMMILVDVALGLLNRTAKQLNVFFVSMPVKSALCFFLMAVSLEFSVGLYLDSMSSVWRTLSNLISDRG